MEAEEWSSSSGGASGASDSEAFLEDSKDDEFFYESSSLTKLQFRKHSLRACWKDKIGIAEVVEHKGRMLTSVGIVRNGKIYCSIEETLFLAEIGALLLVDDKDATIPLKEIYEKVAEGNRGCSWEDFEVYRHLKSLGYIVGRHGIPWSLKNVRTRSKEGFSEEGDIVQTVSNGNSNSVLSDLCANSISHSLNSLKIKKEEPIFEVYLPNSKFRKTSPGVPSFLVYIARGHPPSRLEIEELKRQCGGIPIRVGHVEHGRVSFFSFDQVELPVLP